MADNVVLNSGTGGATVATDEAGAPAKHYQVVKLADGTADSEARIGGDATNGLDVDVTRLPALPAGTNNIGDVDVLTLPSIPAGNNNIGDVDIATIAAGDNNIGNVDVVSLPALPAGTNNIGDVDVLTLPNVTLAAGTNTNEVVGDAAHGAAVAGNPLLQGVEARTTMPAAVTDGQAARVIGDKNGRVVVTPVVPRALVGKARLVLSSTTETTLITAGAGGVFKDLTSLILSNESATEVRVDIRDATGGTPVLSIDLAADGGGAVMNWAVPLPQATAANNWTAQLSAAVSSVYITAQSVDAN